MKSNELTVSKPVSVWNKSISLEPRKFFVSLGKMAVEGVCKDWSDFGGAAIDALDALGLSKKPEDIAWPLISRALFAALTELVKEYHDLFQSPL